MFDAHLDEIDLGKCLIVARLLDVEDGDDVLMVEVPQQLHLSQRSQTEHGMVERCDLLDSHFLTGGLVQRGAVIQLATALWLSTQLDVPDNAVCAFSYDILDVVLL